MRRILTMTSHMVFIVLFAVVLVVLPGHAQAPPDPGLPGPHEIAQMTITTTNPDTGHELQTDIYFPSSDGSSVDPSDRPYATLVFARGFMSFPTSYSGWGEHLARWGYIVAIPDFPSEDQEDRASDVQHLISYLEAENDRGASTFFDSIDIDRFGLTGHSMGGMSTLIVASRDDRIKAGVALDPAGIDDWDYQGDAPDIAAPLAVIGAPSQRCNNSAEYNDVYAHVGATHKVKLVITNGSHCDFMDTEDELQILGCSLFCGDFSEDRLMLAERYATAWFNYYLKHDADYYTYLYGAAADEDVQADLITREVQTAPRDVVAMGHADRVDVSWTLYRHPMVAGYNIYRSQVSGDYPTAPAAQVGRESAYTDADVVVGESYFYVLRSRDSAGNEHQTSEEVSAVPGRPSPVASFDARPTDCCVPLTVVFTDTSTADTSIVPTNTIQSWHWEFGDSVGRSTDRNPVYVYKVSGIYTVTLTVTDAQDYSDTVVQTGAITAHPLPTASFDVSPSVGEAPLEVTLTDTSFANTSIVAANRIEDWRWDFGDGLGSSRDQHPVYTYQQPGVYTVTLTAVDSHGCSDDTRDTVSVVDAFDSFVYLPLVTRDGTVQEPGPVTTAGEKLQPSVGALLNRARTLLRELLTPEKGMGGD